MMALADKYCFGFWYKGTSQRSSLKFRVPSKIRLLFLITCSLFFVNTAAQSSSQSVPIERRNQLVRSRKMVDEVAFFETE